MTDLTLFFNGLDRSTGRPIRSPMTADELAEHVSSQLKPKDPLELEEALIDSATGIARSGVLGDPPPWVNPKDLASSGWGVVFAEGAGRETRGALEELLAHRKAQASRIDEGHYRELTFQPGDDLDGWLARHRSGPGTTDPGRLPYYLLIVGDPAEVPFEFQFELANQHAVGRLHFTTNEEYARYACGVVAAETDSPGLSRNLTLFGVQNPGDKATEDTLNYLLRPVTEFLKRHAHDWELAEVLEEEATKARFRGLLTGSETPALLFTASHGVAPDPLDTDPPGPMGALVCQDWPGEAAGQEPLTSAFYFAAEDVPDEADLTGLISFHFACFSLGTPQADFFAHESASRPRVLARRPLLARLPQRLLGKEGGGALAVIGHVDRARGYSYVWPRVGAQPQSFASVLWRLIDGHPVGSAMRYMADRYAAVALRLNAELLKLERGEAVDHKLLCRLWTATVDARSYAVLGDPAVRLCHDR